MKNRAADSRGGIVWLVGVVVLVLWAGTMYGIFKYNRHQWRVDENTKREVVELIQSQTPVFEKGLSESRRIIRGEEFRAIEVLTRDARVVSLLYLNSDGTIRWFNDASMALKSFDEYIAKYGNPKTDAIRAAWGSRELKVRLVPGELLFEVAYPLTLQEQGGTKMVGVLDLMVKREKVGGFFQLPAKILARMDRD